MPVGGGSNHQECGSGVRREGMAGDTELGINNI